MNSKRMRLLVVGGDAAGMSAAHQALRTAKRAGTELEVVALERTDRTSYSACGIPYWVAGDVDDFDELVARAPDRHRELGVDVRTGTTARGLDLDRGVVVASGPDGRDTEFGFDRLVLATGAHPVVPSWARDDSGALRPGVLPVKTADDGERWLDLLKAERAPRRGLIVGGGYIGLEMAEALLRRGLEVTLVTRGEVMSSLDPDMSVRIRDDLTAAGVKVIAEAGVVGMDTAHGGTLTAVLADGQEVQSDVVVLGMGVRPANELGLSAGFTIGSHGGYLPDNRQQVHEVVWAAGDCCETVDRITWRRVYLPLGTHANKQGRVAGTNVVGGDAEYAGALGTAITRFVAGGVHTEIARVGLSSAEAVAHGVEVEALATEGRTTSGYMPETARMTTKVLTERGTRRLVGMQIVGGPGSGKRIDTAAAAIWGGCTIDDLAGMDLSYAPPFATVWEGVQLAGRRLADRM